MYVCRYYIPLLKENSKERILKHLRLPVKIRIYSSNCRTNIYKHKRHIIAPL